MTEKVTLKGMTWNHSRGYVPMVATAQRFHERNPHVEINWSKRSLQEFADSPIDALADQFDFLVIDHPWAGFAASSEVLMPLETLLDEGFLSELANNSVGRSHASYEYNGSQWALAIDAACPVSARRNDLLEKAEVQAPTTFDELIALGKRGLVCCPSIPLDVYGNFLNLMVADGVTIFRDKEEIADKESAITALERLKQLADVVPHEFFDLNPIRTMEAMSSTDRFAYAPYTYGYTNYSRVGYAERLVHFGDVIGIEPSKPGATMLGGTGLTITAGCKHPEIAALYMQFVAQESTQRGMFYQVGGQPGHRAAWLDRDLDRDCNGFFSATLPTLDRAFVRPRYRGYLGFQDNAGYPIQEFLKSGGSTELLLYKLNDMYRRSQQFQYTQASDTPQ